MHPRRVAALGHGGQTSLCMLPEDRAEVLRNEHLLLQLVIPFATRYPLVLGRAPTVKARAPTTASQPHVMVKRGS